MGRVKEDKMIISERLLLKGRGITDKVETPKDMARYVMASLVSVLTIGCMFLAQAL